MRPLAFPIRKGGGRFEEVRWVQALFDCAPPALPTIGALLGGDRDVLQFKTLRAGPELLGEFRAKRVPERLKRFAASARYERELFDPETLEMGPRPQGARPQPAAAAAAATSPLAPAASREALR